jgi:TrpR family trp operon transcriptional repressor
MKGSSAWTRLTEAVAALNTPAEVETFLSELLTPGERHDIRLRWDLLEWLVCGTPQRKIAADLGVSLCKITRGARILKAEGSVVARALGKESS